MVAVATFGIWSSRAVSPRADVARQPHGRTSRQVQPRVCGRKATQSPVVGSGTCSTRGTVGMHGHAQRLLAFASGGGGGGGETHCSAAPLPLAALWTRPRADRRDRAFHAAAAVDMRDVRLHPCRWPNRRRTYTSVGSGVAALISRARSSKAYSLPPDARRSLPRSKIFVTSNPENASGFSASASSTIELAELVAFSVRVNVEASLRDDSTANGVPEAGGAH